MTAVPAFSLNRRNPGSFMLQNNRDAY